MNRTLVSLLLLLFALVTGKAHAFGEEIAWLDKTIPPALQEKLAGPGSWHRIPAGFDYFSPRPEKPFALKTACADKTPSVFYTELIARGATVLKTQKCNQLLLWLAEGGPGITYTFEELQKKYLPLDSEAEALAFHMAEGASGALDWYGSTIDGVIYLMTDESYCRGLGHIRKILRAGKDDGRSKPIGTVIDPAPPNTGCRLNSP